MPIKNDTINCDAHLHKKSKSSLPSFFRFCKDITNFLFWVLRASIAMTSKNDTVSFMFIFMQKIIFIPHLFLKYYKLVFLAALGVPGHSQISNSTTLWETLFIHKENNLIPRQRILQSDW